jgi:hypothetical protein
MLYKLVKERKILYIRCMQSQLFLRKGEVLLVIILVLLRLWILIFILIQIILYKNWLMILVHYSNLVEIKLKIIIVKYIVRYLEGLD